MPNNEKLAAIQACIENRLAPPAITARRIAAVIGGAPSRYSKSPALWNAAFGRLGIDAVYLPLDVAETRLGVLIAAIRACEVMLGFNVTVPHKQAVMEYLDELDAGAARVGAVNTVVRASDGRLIGYNTDGGGFVDSLLKPQPGRDQSVVATLQDVNVLLLGAGGAARAVAFHVAGLLHGGELIISNRTAGRARALAAEIKNGGCKARGIGEDELALWAPRAQLVVNATTKGQGGMRQLPDGAVTSLEPYSPLAPACALPVVAHGGDQDAWRLWLEANQAGIAANNIASRKLAAAIPPGAVFYDLIYYPEETLFLRHGRETGHPTINGKAMIVNQAALAFRRHICRAQLQAKGIDTGETYQLVLETMYNAW